MQFLPPLADASDFPAPIIRALPYVPTLAEAGSELTRPGWQSLIYARARHALYHIALSVPAGRVWLPAYHCPALVEPFLAAGKEVHFYSHHADLSPRMDGLEKGLQRDDLVVAVRYFGFDCGVAELADLCRQKSCLLVEDLAHAALARHFYGDMAVTSLVKFYPVSEGAELWLPDNSRWRSVISKRHDTLPGPCLQACQRLRHKLAERLLGAPASDYRYFHQRDLSRCLTPQDRQYLARRPDTDVSERRRDNYLTLTRLLSGSGPGWGRVLFESLPDDVTPYVLPFLLTKEEGFAHLRGHAIQIYRWEELVANQCEVSMDYRRRLVQLPCHQDLTAEQLQTIAGVLS